MELPMDELYALLLEESGAILHGECADALWPNGEYPKSSTPVFSGDSWCGEISGTCAACQIPVNADTGD